MDRDTICAIASPEGRGAIGVIRISGRDAFACLDRVFYAKSGKKAAERVPRDMVMGKIYHGDRLVDEGMCAVFFAPASYTGENSAEIYCHGGRVVTREILAALLESGCRLARGGEFTERAFLNGKMDLAAAEAVEELIDAANPVYVSTAAANLSGRFGRRIREIRDELMDVAAHYAACLDYADEGVEPPDPQAVEEKMRRAERELQKLRAGCLDGKIVREGAPVAIVGRTNSGKSTLLNYILGYDRAIVTNIAGTTRDIIEESISLKNGTLRFIDTAGFRETDDPVERIGIERSRESLARAEMVLMLFDGSTAPSEEDRISAQAVENELKNRPNLQVFKVINKQDKGLSFGYEAFLPELDPLYISAETGEGVEKLLAKLEESLKTGSDEADLVTNLRHSDVIIRASDVLSATVADQRMMMTDDVIWSGVISACEILGEITGDEVKEDMIQRIFAQFCVGK